MVEGVVPKQKTAREANLQKTSGLGDARFLGAAFLGAAFLGAAFLGAGFRGDGAGVLGSAAAFLTAAADQFQPGGSAQH